MSIARFRRATRFLLAALLLLAAGAAGAEPVDGTLAVVRWTAPEPALLAPLAKDARLLAHNQDLALLLLPEGLIEPAGLTPALERLERVRESGAYYLYLLADPATAAFDGEATVLARHGHTLVLWTPGGAPRLTEASRAAQPGLQQPVRVTLAPKAWPQEASAPPRERTDFHPIVDQIVSQVSQTEYVAKWQVLDDFETRYYNTVQNTNSSQWMYDTFVSYGLQAQFHTYSHNGTRRNVIGILPGLVDPSRVVYITGHFDSISEDSQNHAPGADDNGSGSAAFLEAARVLSEYGFHYTIKFVGFNSEEQGLIGSDYYCDYIQSQGEDVIAAFNFDMIAYAGTDTPPKDLIIYTNTTSQTFANTLRDACLEYVPDAVEPIVLVENLSGSDHYSFWTHGYAAVTGIEDEAWGDDFCPWYHTSNDRIEQYPQDYPTNCTRAAIAAVAQTAVPLNPTTPYLVLSATDIDDDASGASQGNDNGVIEYNETIELRLTLQNVGQQSGLNVTGELIESDPFVALTTATVSFGTIPAGGTATNSTPFVLVVDPGVPDGHEIELQLLVSEAPGTLDLALEALAPDLNLLAFDVDDAAGGDGDGIAEPGEAIALGITIRNDGSVGAGAVTGTLSAGGFVLADPTPQAFGVLGAGATATGGPFALTIDAGCPPIYPASLALLLAGANEYETSEGFVFQVGQIFRDDLEAGAGGWTHYAGGTGFSDQWHLETYRNHTYGGDTSWKCGGAGSASYANLLHAILESGPFSLPAGSELSLWHWMDAEVSGSYAGYCYDGGLVQISIDGGAWETITPAGGYPYLIRTGGTPGPFPAETPVYSGTHDWRQETFDLAGYQGSARIRFVFGSDGSAAEEGWYVDDIEVLLQFSAAEEPGRIQRLELHPAGPNPSAGGSALRFVLPREEAVSLRVHDAAGRVVRTLHAGPLAAGPHALAWDGLRDGGSPAAAGVYWLRLRAGEEEQATRLVVVR